MIFQRRPIRARFDRLGFLKDYRAERVRRMSQIERALLRLCVIEGCTLEELTAIANEDQP